MRMKERKRKDMTGKKEKKREIVGGGGILWGKIINSLNSREANKESTISGLVSATANTTFTKSRKVCITSVSVTWTLHGAGLYARLY